MWRPIFQERRGGWVFEPNNVDLVGQPVDVLLQVGMVTLLADIANSLRDRTTREEASSSIAVRYQTAVMHFAQDHPQICTVGESLVGDVFPKILRLAHEALRGKDQG